MSLRARRRRHRDVDGRHVPYQQGILRVTGQAQEMPAGRRQESRPTATPHSATI